MPRDDDRELVSAVPLPGRGAPPGIVEQVGVLEIGATSDCGCVERRIFVGWRYTDGAPVRRFAIFIRRAEDLAWDHVGYGVGAGKTICCPLGLGIDYVVAVLAEGPDGAHLPIAAAATCEFRLYGTEQVPAAPENLRCYRVDTGLVVAWDPVEYAAPLSYELLVGGSNVAAAEVALQTRVTTVELPRFFPGADTTVPIGLTFMVVAVTATGLRGSAAVLADQQLLGAIDQAVVADSDSGSTWSGTKTGCEVVGGDLVVSDGETAATYQHGTLDVGALSEYVIAAAVRASIENVGLLWDMALFEWSSAQARHRRWDGEGDDWFPTDGIAWRESPTWDELTETWDSLSWMTWDSYSVSRDPDDPAAMTWDDARFSWDSAFAASWTWDGPVSAAGTGAALEIQTSTDNVTWTDWAEWRPETRIFRYLRWRVVIAQPVPAMTVTLDRIVVAVLQPRVAGAGTMTSLTMPSAEFSVADPTGDAVVTWDTQVENKVFAGPATPGAATPTFRNLVVADLPTGIPGTSSSTRLTTPGDGTWAHPAGATWVMVDMIGGSGGGGGGSNRANGTLTGCGGAGGGGGARIQKWFLLADLPDPVPYHVAAGGGGGAGAAGSSGAVGSDGGAGESSTWGATIVDGAYAIAGGGGPGGGGPLNTVTSGGAGGGTGGPGEGDTGSGGALADRAKGGVPRISATSTSSYAVQGTMVVGGQGGWGGSGGNSASGLPAEWGGGGGGASSDSIGGSGQVGTGGSSLHGGGGGGVGGSYVGGTLYHPMEGGGSGGWTTPVSGTYTAGTGGAAGVSGSSPTAGTAGANGSTAISGKGGGGGGGTVTNDTAGANGGAGGSCGGGGGGGGCSRGTGAGGNGGAGGRGEIRLIWG